MSSSDLLQAFFRVGAGLLVDAVVTVLAQQNQILISVPLMCTQGRRGPRSAVTGAGYVCHVANDHNRIIIGLICKEFDTALGHRAATGRAAPEQLKCEVAVAARRSRAASACTASATHCNRPKSIN